MKNTLSAPQKEKPKPKPSLSSRLRNGSFNDRLRRWYLFFSILWIASVCAYGFGNWREMRSIGGHLSYMEVLALIAILFVPLIVLWTPIWLTAGEDSHAGLGALPARLDNQTRLQLPAEVDEKLEKIDSELTAISGKLSLLDDNQSQINSKILATLPLMNEQLVAIAGGGAGFRCGPVNCC